MGGARSLGGGLGAPEPGVQGAQVGHDFFYLPIDFRNKCNVGDAFMNMKTPEDILPLYAHLNNKKWARFNSEKVCVLTYGRIQGFSALTSHFQRVSLRHEDKRRRPLVFK